MANCDKEGEIRLGILMNITLPNITSLKANEIFVFGSNLAGRHGRGAALIAKRKFGAKWGQGYGLMGQSYGICTKGRKLDILPLTRISVHIINFIKFAVANPQLHFLVTPIGCGLAGYSPKDIAPLFFRNEIPENVSLPESFWELKP